MVGLAEFVELCADELVGLLREAGAGAAGVDELAVAVVAEEQRADAVDSGVAFGGEGEAADDELLLADAFELEPVGGAAGDVRCRRRAWRRCLRRRISQALLEDGGAVGFEVLAEADVVAASWRGAWRGGLCVRGAEGCAGCGR